MLFIIDIKMKQAKYLPKGDYNIVSQEWQF